MHIRTFRASNLNAALVKIREEMGDEAQVLHTRRVSDGWRGWLRGGRVEVTAGVAGGMRQAGSAVTPVERVATLTPPVTMASGALSGVKPAAGRADERMEAARLDEGVRGRMSARLGADRIAGDHLELDPQRRWAADLLASELEDAGLPSGIARRWLRLAHAEAASEQDATRAAETPAELDPLIGLRQGLACALREQCVVGKSWEEVVSDVAAGEQARIALVGPAGVGKTTTLAKLAASVRLAGGYRLGLLTTDVYRAAGVEQLEAYARAMSVPLAVVRGVDDLAAGLERLTEADVVFVDTVGMAGRDERMRAHQLELLEHLRPQQRQLLLDAHGSYGATRDTIRALSDFSFDTVSVTKTDQVARFAPVLAAVWESGLPLSYVATGQRVPHDVRRAEPLELASWSSGLAVMG